MELNLELIYRCVQAAAVLFLAARIFLIREKGIGSFCRGMSLFTAIGALILLYLCRQRDVKLPIRIWLAVNGIVFLVFALDKFLAVRGSQTRIPENVLLILSFFGIAGGLSGMLVFHHKNKKAKLQYAVPVFACIQAALLYYFQLRGKSLPVIQLKNLSIFQIMTVVTTLVLCITLVRTFILVRLLISIPVSLLAAGYGVSFIGKLNSSLTLMEVAREKPVPFWCAAALLFLILELIAVKSRFITSANEVRKKTDHSGRQ